MPSLNPLTYLKIGACIALLLFATWAFRVNSLRAEWKQQTETITAAVGTAAGLRNLRPENAAAAVKQLGDNLLTCRQNGTRLEASIVSQNAAIEAARAAGAATEARLQQVAVAARREAETANARARAILARPRTGNACADADALIRDSIQ